MKYIKTGFLMLFFLFLTASVCYGADKKEGIENFPSSYQPYLKELQKNHPNWKFVAFYPNLDWTYVINNENQFGKNLVPKSYSDSWKNTTPGQYNVEIDAGWVDCSRRALDYTMDPRNFLNEVRIFQFEGLSYEEKTNNKEGIEKILYGTEFYKRMVDYVTSTGNVINMNCQYSDLILNAGKTSKVSSYHLASRIKQEVGPFLSHSSISGRVAGFEGLYNFYNIGATSSAEPMGAIKNGLQYAKDGKGASQAIKDKYLIPWNNKERAITGGGIFIGSSYIHLGQDTLYLQKFHVYSNNNGSLFWHQYMTNVLAPYSEAKSIYQGYANSGMLDTSMTFFIPVYENMLTIPVPNPNISENDFIPDNTKVYAEVSNTLNVRCGPSTSYEVLTQVDRNVVMTRIAKGKQAGELWDRVELPNGIIGYVFQNYLREKPNILIEKINIQVENTTMKKGETQKLKVEILPNEAQEKEVEYSSSNEKVVMVDQEGNLVALKSGIATISVNARENNVSNSIEIKVITPVTDLQVNTESIVMQEEDQFVIIPIIFPTDADNQNISYTVENQEIATVDSLGKVQAHKVGKTKLIVTTKEASITREVLITVVEKLKEDEIELEEGLKIERNEISGWNLEELSVEKIKEKIKTSYQIKIYNAKQEEITNEQIAGTGSKIQLLDEKNQIKMEYYIVIYGDVNGDGKINSTDLLVLQRHILEIEKQKGLFLKAGNINKNGKNPSSLDSLLIQRHILGLKMIDQKS